MRGEGGGGLGRCCRTTTTEELNILTGAELTQLTQLTMTVYTWAERRVYVTSACMEETKRHA
jgi:hypothetical protein